MATPAPAPAPAAAESSQPVQPVAVAGTNEDNVVVDDYGDGADSAYDSEMASYTTSLASSITDYKIHMGRRFHAYKEGSYMFPNDEKEQDRLDIMHKLWEVAIGALYSAPVKDPKRVLDLGTGTGIWALEFGDRFPQADVLGNDLSPVQPRWVPPNVRFEVDDVEADWTYSQKFDYIHCRGFYGAIRDWPKLVRQTFEFTAPGGWAEFTDLDCLLQSPDNSVAPDSALATHNKNFNAMAEKMGCETRPAKHLEKWVTDAGFTDLKVKRCPLPMGTWAKDRHLKEVGSWMYLQTTEGLESFVAYTFTNILGWQKEEVDVLCAKVRSQLKDPKCHSMLMMVNVVAKKPESK